MSRPLGIPGGSKPSKATGDIPAEERCGYVVDLNGKRRLLTSDRYILANLPVADDAPLGPISVSGLRAIEAHWNATIADDGVDVDHGEGHHEEHRRPTGESYERFGQRMVEALPRWEIADGDEATVICLNPRLLRRLAKAIAVDAPEGVRLRIARDPRAPIVVEPLIENGATGLLMPMRDPLRGATS